MNVGDEIRKIEIELRNLNRRLASIRSGIDLPAHHTTHELGGSDSMKLDNLATPDDNTDLNASITEHGLLNKLDNDPTHFLDGQGNWSVAGGASIEFLDNFGDAARHWGWFDDAKNGTIAEAGGLLTLSIANTANGRIGDGTLNNGPRVLLGDPGAPFEIKVKLNSYTVNDYTHAGIFVCADSNSGGSTAWYLFGRGRDSSFAFNGLGTWTGAGWNDGVINAVTTLPIYLRFRIVVLSIDVGARVEAAYSADDITYTVLQTFYMNNLVSSNLENMTVGIFARNGVGAATYNAIVAPFEWFKMTRTLGPG